MVPIEPWQNSIPFFGAVAFCTTKNYDFRASLTTLSSESSSKHDFITTDASTSLFSSKTSSFYRIIFKTCFYYNRCLNKPVLFWNKLILQNHLQNMLLLLPMPQQTCSLLQQAHSTESSSKHTFITASSLLKQVHST